VSSEHSKVAVVSVELNVNVATALAVEDAGPELIVVFGALVSTVIDRLAGAPSTWPSPSTARTRNVCAPDESVEVVNGDGQFVNAPVSTEHWNVDGVSLDVNANVGVESFVGPLGPEVIVVSGAVVSAVNARVAGVGSVFPAGSVARTENVYGPSRSAAGVNGDAQAVYVLPSSEQANVEPVSLAVNENVGVESLVAPVGPAVIVVSGGVTSPDCTVQECVAGV
jgi:hypothetical protein